ncbi:MAG: [FeFe] hydrogenase H-cluster maturation GTPase HydF [Planctomycetia bacterium]|nr:[FeFe] hydrogenase H-cluster maturation GTPase HydF [Planctomycetia bacterium]
MMDTPKGFRLHLGIFGRRNAGKSSLLNRLTRQTTSIVSNIAGTTTDPVEKPMELLPLGPVLFIDTAGIDDDSDLGQLRVQKTLQVFDRTEIGILVVDVARPEPVWTLFEEKIVHELENRKIPVLVVLNKIDLCDPAPYLLEKLESQKIPFVLMAAGKRSEEVRILKEELVRIVPEDFLTPPPIASDLLPEGETAVLVVPIDKEAPKGRLILPQVQTIRDLLDGNQRCVVVKEDLLEKTIQQMDPAPALVITDSQAFKAVSEIVPPEIPLTSFSILFARQKGNFSILLDGARAIGRLKPKSRVLIAEACSHHPITEDIGTEKIPRWLKNYIAPDLEIGHVQGHEFPATSKELARWDLMIHCGACMWNRREMLCRINRCLDAGIPITNYGLAIAFMLGILERAVEPLIRIR